MLGDYEGTVLLISHDRDFLDRMVDAVIVPEGDGRWIEYAGGYSDMLAQRGSDLRRDDIKVASKPAAAEARRPAPERKRRLSFNEKHALETLPGPIASLQSVIETLNRTMADPELYARDRSAFDRASADLVETQRKLAAAEERWLELEILREDLTEQ